jgi:predicted DNA-binding protein YlxM (UPF0122 family)
MVAPAGTGFKRILIFLRRKGHTSRRSHRLQLYSYAEIADHLNISHITIKRHIARALLALMEYRDDATLPFQE